MQNINEIEDLIKLISKFPGLGPKSAKRIVLKLINNKDEIVKPLVNTLAQVYKNIVRCNFCGSLKSNSDGCTNCENIKEKFNDYILTFDVHVQEDDDKLFGSINLQNIVEKLNNDGYELEKKQVNLPSGPIKIFADDYIATVSLYADVSVTIPIKLTKIAKPSPENTSENPSSESPE